MRRIIAFGLIMGLSCNLGAEIEKGSLEKKEEEAHLIKPEAIPPILQFPLDNEPKKTFSKKALPQGILSGWTQIMTEGFEGSFPSGPWHVFDDDGSTNGEYYWDDTLYKSHTGVWSGWCAKGGMNGLNPESNNYPNNCNSWMEYGPFNLSDATDANLSFYFWNKSESTYDYLFWGASINGTNYYGSKISGDCGDTWNSRTLDLKNVPILGNLCGQSQVYITFLFKSDSSTTYKGAFVDDILLQKYVAPSGDSWDPTDDTPSGATLLTPITTEQSHGPHTLSSTDLYDWYKIYMTTGITYNFNTVGGQGDNYGELYNGPGENYTCVAFNDDSGGNSQFSFSYQAAVTQYYYLRIRTYSVGNSWSGNLKYSYTGGTPPSAPSNLSATPISSTQINLSWTDNANNETGFNLERKVSGGNYTQIATPGANITSYQNTGLIPNTTYYYRVRAYNTYGDSAYSNEAQATTQGGGPEVVYTDNFNDGDISDWQRSSGTNLWHLEGNSYYSSPKSLAYNDGIDYDNGAANSGWAASPQINLTGKTGNITLSLWTKWQHESYSWGDYDNMRIEVYDGSQWRRVFYNDCNEGAPSSDWHEETIDITQFSQNRVIQVRFSFNTIDDLYNNYFGWYIDDLKIIHNPSGLSFLSSQEIDHIDEQSPPRRLSPEETAVLKPFPNPAKDVVYLPFQLNEPANVEIAIYNILGQRVNGLNIGERVEGFYTTSSSAPVWNLTNDKGERLSSGLYFCKIDIKTNSGKKFTANNRIIIQR
ncbi:MAG: fibronectin type III domain-containing protein [bacterium]|nr:fibronectin type III domain-containing protein [bacterium]